MQQTYEQRKQELAEKIARIEWESKFVSWNDLSDIEKKQMADTYLPLAEMFLKEMADIFFLQTMRVPEDKVEQYISEQGLYP